MESLKNNQTSQSGLYIIPTPIGNLNDITLRAIETLKAMDIVFCEDTRVSQKLLSHYGISVKTSSYHDHNASLKSSVILDALSKGKKIGLISDAGTPLISDPGYELVQLCYTHHYYVTVLPGASAVTSALVLSGQPTYPFAFLGFLDPSKHLIFHQLDMTLLFYEAPHRLTQSLKWLSQSFSGRNISVIRELSKKFEQVVQGTYESVLSHFENHPPRGEIVIVLSPPTPESQDTESLEKALLEALSHHRVKDAATMVAETFLRPKKEVYKLALELMNRKKD